MPTGKEVRGRKGKRFRITVLGVYECSSIGLKMLLSKPYSEEGSKTLKNRV